jgi:uncharacterized membrane protein YgdD (TMEM256/DUF423 family)
MLPVIAVAFAALSGAMSVALGAFGAHALRDSLSPRLLETFQTGVTYQMSHSLALLLVAILISHWGRTLALDLAVYFFMAGIVLFCGSLYGLALTEMKWLGPVTPLGGVFFIAGWLSLVTGSMLKLTGP